MPWKTNPDLAPLITAIVVSIVAGFVSISQRVLRGHAVSILWVASEFLGAMLSGYMVYSAYPYLHGYIPEFVTLPMLVAFAAHLGGRTLQLAESYLYIRYGHLFEPPRDR